VKWGNVPCEHHLDMVGSSILRDGESLYQGCTLHEHQKRIGLIFLSQDMVVDDNVRKSGDVIKGLGRVIFCF
jgi:hypothetical protein